MADKIYLVLERGFEYNDEIYSNASDYGDDLGTPQGAFRDKDEAIADCVLKTRDRLQGLDIANYYYDARDFWNDDPVTIANEAGIPPPTDEWDWTLPKVLTTEQAKILMRNISQDDQFFYLVETDLQ